MGRHRKYDYQPEISRNAAMRNALREAGGAIVSVALQPEANAALEAIMAQTGESKVAIINRLILQAGAKP